MTTSQHSSEQKQASNIRLDIARALTQIVGQGRTIEWVRAERPQWLQSPLHSELLYGTLRHYLSLSEQLNAQLKKRLKAKDLDLFSLMLVGAYQLKYTAVAEYAAINECVSACKSLGKPWAKGLVNAVLRSLQRMQPSEENAVIQAVADHPKWLQNHLNGQYGNQAKNLMMANNLRAPMTLRINQSTTNPEQFKEKLRSADIGFTNGPWPETIVLDEPQIASNLPGWFEGECSVQDLSAQHAAHIILQILADVGLGETRVRILDACAAPGGKLFHLREVLTHENITHELYALDNKAKRLQELTQIANRLGHRTYAHDSIEDSDAQAIGLTCADGGAKDLPYEHQFDLILLDAPCSGSGTIRRNPDIRLLLKPSALREQQVLQLSLLQNLWHRLKAGSTLVYSTCSVFAEENDQVIQRFLSETSDACLETLRLDVGFATQYGWQLLPTEPLTDGFYYSLLKKSLPNRGQQKANSQ